MHQESHAFSKEKYEGLIQSKILLRVKTFSKLLKDERFGRFIKRRSIVDLQQTLKFVRFTKIQHKDERFIPGAYVTEKISEPNSELN